MSIFGKKQTNDISGQIDKLYKELALQIEINQELKNENEKLKSEVLSREKEMARFEEKLRINPLSQLEILHKELSFMCENTSNIVNNQNDMVKEKMTERAKDVCTDAFELLNLLKNIVKEKMVS